MTSDAFWLDREGEAAQKELKRWKLDAVSAKLAGQLRPLLRKDEESPSEQAKRLELLASLLFLVRTGQAVPHDTEGTSKTLKRNDKPFEATQVADAVRELQAYGLLA